MSPLLPRYPKWMIGLWLASLALTGLLWAGSDTKPNGATPLTATHGDIARHQNEAPPHARRQPSPMQPLWPDWSKPGGPTVMASPWYGDGLTSMNFFEFKAGTYLNVPALLTFGPRGNNLQVALPETAQNKLISVEVKTFVVRSFLHDWDTALSQLDLQKVSGSLNAIAVENAKYITCQYRTTTERDHIVMLWYEHTPSAAVQLVKNQTRSMIAHIKDAAISCPRTYAEWEQWPDVI